MTREELSRYMERRCLCGHTRSEHAHAHRAKFGAEGKILEAGGRLSVFCVLCGSCQNFTDEIERSLSGNPLKVFGPDGFDIMPEETLRKLGAGRPA